MPGGTGQQSGEQVLAEAMAIFDEALRRGQAGSGGTGQRPAGADQPGAMGGGTGMEQGQQPGGATNSPDGNMGYGNQGQGEEPYAGQGGGNNGEDDGTGAEHGAGGTGSATQEERVGSLDRQLEEGMADFDGIILERRAEVIARDNREGSTGGGRGSAASGGQYPGDEGGDSAPLLTASAEQGGNTVRGSAPPLPGSGRQGDYNQADMPEDMSERIPDDIPDGDDDDIVARQLREAAMAEEDPELREKLWDEYRKYKQSVQAQR